jgi:hypothetical protein
MTAALVAKLALAACGCTALLLFGMAVRALMSIPVPRSPGGVLCNLNSREADPLT